MKFFAVLSLCLVASVLASPAKKPQRILPIKDLAGRIINGEEARAGQIPFQVGLILDGSIFCGGSLISPTFVLTAGHCVEDVSTAEVRLGVIDIYDTGATIANSRRLIPHPDLIISPFLIANDIALIELSSAVTLTSNIQTISLGSGTVGASQAVQVSGWGLTSDSSTSINQYLKFVALNTISNDDCAETFFFIGDEVVCAEANYSDGIRSSCNGDSGGPLVVDASGSPSVVGVVSFGSGAGCESGAPSAYTRVAYFGDWIQEQTGIRV